MKGLPVLTCKGDAFSGRVAASLLTSVGMPELIAESLAAYESRALELALDQAQLTALSERLRRNLLHAPLFDADGFRRGIEQAFVMMREQDRPQSFSVPK